MIACGNAPTREMIAERLRCRDRGRSRSPLQTASHTKAAAAFRWAAVNDLRTAPRCRHRVATERSSHSLCPRTRRRQGAGQRHGPAPGGSTAAALRAAPAATAAHETPPRAGTPPPKKPLPIGAPPLLSSPSPSHPIAGRRRPRLLPSPRAAPGRAHFRCAGRGPEAAGAGGAGRRRQRGSGR